MAHKLTCSSLPSDYGYLAAFQTICECYCKFFSMKTLSLQVSMKWLLASYKYKIIWLEHHRCRFPDIPEFIHLLFLIYSSSLNMWKVEPLFICDLQSTWRFSYNEVQWGLKPFEVSMCYTNSLRYQCVTAERRKASDLLWLQNLKLCSRFTQTAPVLVTCEATGNCGTSYNIRGSVH